MNKWKHFSVDEMKCKHCGECHMDEGFMSMLDNAREISGIPYPVRSGYRCIDYDEEIGGKGNHQGKAADIGFNSGEQAMKIIIGLIKAGFKRIGISFKDRFIHADTMQGRPLPWLWSY